MKQFQELQKIQKKQRPQAREALQLLDDFYKSAYTRLYSISLKDEDQLKLQQQQQMVTNQCLIKFEKVSCQISDILLNSKNDMLVYYKDYLKNPSLSVQDVEQQQKLKQYLDQFFELLNSSSFLEICDIMRQQKKNQLQKEIASTVNKFRKRFLPFLIDTELQQFLSQDQIKEAQNQLNKYKQYSHSWKVQLFQDYIGKYMKNQSKQEKFYQSELFKIMQNFQPNKTILLGVGNVKDAEKYLMMEGNKNILEQQSQNNNKIIIQIQDDEMSYQKVRNQISKNKENMDGHIVAFRPKNNIVKYIQEQLYQEINNSRNGKAQQILARLAETDLIYCEKILNDMEDSQIVDLLNWAYEKLRPGGLLMLKNLYTKNRARGAIQFFSDKAYKYRDQEIFKEILKGSQFWKGKSDINSRNEQMKWQQIQDDNGSIVVTVVKDIEANL